MKNGALIMEEDKLLQTLMDYLEDGSELAQDIWREALASDEPMVAVIARRLDIPLDDMNNFLR